MQYRGHRAFRQGIVADLTNKANLAAVEQVLQWKKARLGATHQSDNSQVEAIDLLQSGTV